MRMQRNIAGIIPPYMYTDLARLNPDVLHYLDSLRTTQALFKNAPLRRIPYLRFVGAGPTSVREVYDAQTKEELPGVKARFEGENPSTGDADVNTVYDFTGWVRKFYWDIHGRNGIDANGMKFVSSVNYGQNYNNAFFDGSQMAYGKGDGRIFSTFVLLDVTGHEITHGVTQYVSNWEYYGQSGALNESISDVFGELIEQFSKNETADVAKWLVGDGIFMPKVKGKALRSMLDPGTAYDDPGLGKDPQPGHMKDYVKTWSDNGGVHINSGIPNKAFALVATRIGGHAWEKAGKIWYAARGPSGDKPSFAQFAYHTVEAAKNLFPEMSAAQVTGIVDTVRGAWNDVGVTPSAAKTDDLTPVAPAGTNPDEDAA